MVVNTRIWGAPGGSYYNTDERLNFTNRRSCIEMLPRITKMAPRLFAKERIFWRTARCMKCRGWNFKTNESFAQNSYTSFLSLLRNHFRDNLSCKNAVLFNHIKRVWANNTLLRLRCKLGEMLKELSFMTGRGIMVYLDMLCRNCLSVVN